MARDLITSTFLIILLMVFMLVDLPASLDRIRQASGQRRGPMDYISRVASGLRRYFAIKTAISVATGLLAGTLVYAMGVDYPLLWGLMAFLFNFIPAIGSILAAIPPVILALISNGPTDALIVAAGYLVINGVMGNRIEPRVTGLGLGLTTLTVFTSLLFWGWVLGPVGLLLSVPLTLAVKLGLENHPRTRWVSILMGG